MRGSHPIPKKELCEGIRQFSWVPNHYLGGLLMAASSIFEAAGGLDWMDRLQLSSPKIHEGGIRTSIRRTRMIDSTWNEKRNLNGDIVYCT
jgi:hypothetical protein